MTAAAQHPARVTTTDNRVAAPAADRGLLNRPVGDVFVVPTRLCEGCGPTVDVAGAALVVLAAGGRRSGQRRPRRAGPSHPAARVEAERLARF